LQDKGNAQGTDNCPGRKAGTLQEDEGIAVVNKSMEQLFPRHLIDRFREKALEEAIEEERWKNLYKHTTCFPTLNPHSLYNRKPAFRAGFQMVS
jgi:hypothetical protein